MRKEKYYMLPKELKTFVCDDTNFGNKFIWDSVLQMTSQLLQHMEDNLVTVEVEVKENEGEGVETIEEPKVKPIRKIQI